VASEGARVVDRHEVPVPEDAVDSDASARQHALWIHLRPVDRACRIAYDSWIGPYDQVLEARGARTGLIDSAGAKDPAMQVRAGQDMPEKSFER